VFSTNNYGLIPTKEVAVVASIAKITLPASTASVVKHITTVKTRQTLASLVIVIKTARVRFTATLTGGAPVIRVLPVRNATVVETDITDSLKLDAGQSKSSNCISCFFM